MLKRQDLLFGDETNLLAKNRVDTGLRAFILELRPTNADGTSNLTVHHDRYPATLGKIIDPNGGLITTAHDRFFKYGGWTAPMRRRLRFEDRGFRSCCATSLHDVEIHQHTGHIDDSHADHGIALGRKGETSVDDFSGRIRRQLLAIEKRRLRHYARRRQQCEHQNNNDLVPQFSYTPIFFTDTKILFLDYAQQYGREASG